MENEKVLEEQIIKIKKFVDLYKLEEENSDTIIIDRKKYKKMLYFYRWLLWLKKQSLI